MVYGIEVLGLTAISRVNYGWHAMNALDSRRTNGTGMMLKEASAEATVNLDEGEEDDNKFS